MYTVYKRPTIDLGILQIESEGLEKLFHMKRNQKKAGVAMPINVITGNQEGHCMVIKGSIQEDVTIINK